MNRLLEHMMTLWSREMIDISRRSWGFRALKEPSSDQRVVFNNLAFRI
jgi:hypothetical protein